MHLENVVVDAADPQSLGRFWQAALETETLSDRPDGCETRLAVPYGPVLDLCFQPVPEVSGDPQRLHLDLTGGVDPRSVVERLVALGASPREGIGQGKAAWLLDDPEGNPFSVLADKVADTATGPLAALRLDAADPVREREFWSWLTGWVPDEDGGVVRLRHPSRRGTRLELYAQASPKGSGKNPRHLDVRLGAEDDDDAVARGIADRGGRELHPDWGDLPWRVFADPSGNEFCVLPSGG